MRLIATLLLASAASSATPANSTLAVLNRWTLGGSGGWDYLTLDGRGSRLFISRATRVEVIDTRDGRLIGTIADTNGVHGIALAADLKRGYVSNGKADSMTVFDLDTLRRIKEVPVPGHNPDAILYDQSGRHVFTFNGRSKDVTIFDGETLAVIKTLSVPDKPEFAVDDGEGHLFLNIESDQGQMVVIDSRHLEVSATWPLPGCASPSGLAIDQRHHRLFSVCSAGVMAITDSLTGNQVAKVPIGESPDAAAFDPRRGLVFSSNGDGTLTVVHQDTADRYRVVASVPTMRGARTMALDTASGKIYLVSAQFAPAPATADQPHPHPTPIPDTFTVLVVGAR